MVAPNKKLLRIVLAIFTVLLLLGCSATGDENSGGTPPDDPSLPPITVAAVGLAAGNTTILLNDNTTITATVFSNSGLPVSGATVAFSVSNPVLASITASATTNASGVAVATFTARTTPGNVTVSASVGTVNSTQNPQITISASTPPSTINVTANPSTLLINQSATITAEVLDEIGNPVADGTAVTFSVDNTSLGSMSSSSGTTTAGFVSRTFQALSTPGTVTIRAAAGSVQAQVSISIMQSPPQSLAFISADPQTIALQTTGGTTTSLVRFQVRDSGGAPLQGINVAFILEGPNGGESLSLSSASSDGNGNAEVILNSGTVAGPVTITGTITTTAGPFVTRSSVISIGGGVPSAKRFGVAATVLNLPGLVWANEQTEITAYLADRFGNYNILEGTTISFAAEAGLALFSNQVTLNDQGYATVMARTQPPSSGVAPEAVNPIDWELALQSYIAVKYGVSFEGHPRRGWASILVHTPGEEHFDDFNGNGVYDPGEFDPAVHDTPVDPFLDYNDNGRYDGPGNAMNDPVEIYVDSNGNRQPDGLNGVWDANKLIFMNFKILLTGGPQILIATNVSQEPSQDFTLGNGQSKTITFLVCDINLNTLIKGTTVDISYEGTGASLVGNKSWTLPDVGPGAGGQIEFPVTLADSDASNSTIGFGVITVKVKWRGNEYISSYSGAVNWAP